MQRLAYKLCHLYYNWPVRLDISCLLALTWLILHHTHTPYQPCSRWLSIRWLTLSLTVLNLCLFLHQPITVTVTLSVVGVEVCNACAPRPQPPCNCRRCTVHSHRGDGMISAMPNSQLTENCQFVNKTVIGGLCTKTGWHTDRRTPSTLRHKVFSWACIIYISIWDICGTQNEPPGTWAFKDRLVQTCLCKVWGSIEIVRVD